MFIYGHVKCAGGKLAIFPIKWFECILEECNLNFISGDFYG